MTLSIQKCCGCLLNRCTAPPLRLQTSCRSLDSVLAGVNSNERLGKLSMQNRNAHLLVGIATQQLPAFQIWHLAMPLLLLYTQSPVCCFRECADGGSRLWLRTPFSRLHLRIQVADTVRGKQEGKT